MLESRDFNLSIIDSFSEIDVSNSFDILYEIDKKANNVKENKKK